MRNVNIPLTLLTPNKARDTHSLVSVIVMCKKRCVSANVHVHTSAQFYPSTAALVARRMGPARATARCTSCN